MFTPFAFIKSPLPIPSAGLVAWYDAADYTSGTTWVDRSGNGLNLTFSGSNVGPTTWSGQPYVDIGASTYGYTAATNLLSGATDITVININYITSLDNTTSAGASQGYGEWSINDTISNFVFAGISVTNSSPVIYTAPIGVWITGQTGYRTNITLQAPWPGEAGGNLFEFNYPVMNEMWYSGNNTPYRHNMIAYRFGSGFTSGNLKIGRVDSGPSVNNSAPSPYSTTVNTWPTGYEAITNNLPLTLTRAGAFSTTYNLGASAYILLGRPTSSGGTTGGKYGVNIFYNRQLSDTELTQIYQYYKSRYNFR